MSACLAMEDVMITALILWVAITASVTLDINYKVMAYHVMVGQTI